MGRKRNKTSGAQWWAIGLVAVVVAVTGGLVGAALIPKAPPPSNAGSPATYDFDEYFTAEQSDAAAPTVAFVGDSYTSGVGSTSPAQGWPTVAATQNEWSAQVFAQGGTGYRNGEPGANYAARLDAIIDASPAAVIVAGGRNDLAFTPGEVEASATDFLTSLRDRLPGVAVYVVAPWWDDDDPPAEFWAVSDAIRAAAESSGAVFIDTGQPLAGRAELLTPDGVHPNDAGHAALGETVAAAITLG